MISKLIEGPLLLEHEGIQQMKFDELSDDQWEFLSNRIFHRSQSLEKRIHERI